MSQQNGQGPNDQGPGTGRGLGKCRNNNEQNGRGKNCRNPNKGKGRGLGNRRNNTD